MSHSKRLSYFIKTFGCAANEADSERLAALMEKQGHFSAKRIEEADVVIINTCSVRESAENRVFGLVNKLTKGLIFSPGSVLKQKLILTGCMVGSAKGERKRYPLSLLKKKLSGVDEFKTIDELLGSKELSPERLEKKKALVPIMEGCNHFCTYCVVPYAREKETSRPFEEIVREVKDLAKRGYREITLIGQNVNSYGKLNVKPEAENPGQSPDTKKSKSQFARLLRTLHRIKGIENISFLTSNPWDLNDEIIKAMVLPKIDRYLHLAVQSGDDQVLRRMNRGYTAKGYLNLVDKIRREVPGIQIGTDIIVGFPGETKKAFQNTVKLCRKAGFVRAYVSRYSPRPGTVAAKLKDSVSPAEKRRRWRVLDGLINKQKL